jgi:phosphoglycolate phosphatase
MAIKAAIKAAIFDLDGTLVDSLADIGGAMNHALALHGLPTHPIESYLEFVGEGVHRLAEKALPPGGLEHKDAVLDEYRRYYAANLLVRTAPYPGIEALLDGLTARGVALAVLSNKPDAPTRTLVEQLFSRWPMRAVHGERAGVPRKPDPTAALDIARVVGVQPAECMFVGDTAIDMRTANAAGMLPVGVLWGFRGQEELQANGARVLVRHPSEILALTHPDVSFA